MAMIGMIVPFIEPMSSTFGTTPGRIGFGIALFSVPSALLATLGGVLIDRLGGRLALLAAGSATALADLVASNSHGVAVFDLAMLVGGLGMAGTAVGAPTLLVGTMQGGTRTRAMAFLSTYAPTGYASGLLLAIPFTGTVDWRDALLLHAAITVFIVASGLVFLPATPPAPRVEGKVRGPHWVGVFRHWPALRLGLAVGLPNGIAYGTSLVAPSYLARLHGVSLAASSGAVAGAKIAALLLGGIITGYVLARHQAARLMFAVMAGLGIVTQIVFFLPQSSFPIAIGALVGWLFAFGGMSGIAMTMLPRVAPAPSQSGATAGLINQFISVVSFAAPSTYFAVSGWTMYAGLAVAGLCLSAAILPAGLPRRLAPRPALATGD
jgi:predicted MFS family arabinose efflux permease